jgi:hypothetical protein
MPQDHGCWLDQHHGVEDLRANAVQPHPQDPVCGQKPRSTFTLSPQDGHLMSQGNKLKFQGGAAANTEFEDRNKGAENRHHVCDGTAAAGKTLVFLDSSKF